MSLSDNLSHVITAVAVLAAGVALVIFAHSYVDASYILTTCFTLVGAILGYKFGADNPAPAQPVIVQAPASAAPAPAVHPLELEAMPPVTNVMQAVQPGTPRPAAG